MKSHGRYTYGKRTDEAMKVEMDRRRKSNLLIKVYGLCRRERQREEGLKEKRTETEYGNNKPTDNKG